MLARNERNGSREQKKTDEKLSYVAYGPVRVGKRRWVHMVLVVPEQRS